jgi:hypothetical protein
MEVGRRGPGRPHKFGRPSRAVTVTLPEDVIARLSAIDVDLGRAIVAVVQRRRLRPAAKRPAELESYGSRSVIVVPPVKALRQLAGVQLVPIGDNRALISLEHPHCIPQLELAIRDALDHDDVGRPERTTFEAVAAILQRARRAAGIDIGERTIIVLEAKRPRRSH